MSTTTAERGAGRVWAADPNYTDLVRRRGGELLRLGVLLTGNRYDAEDALQEALIAVSRAWPRVLAAASESAAFAYLRTAMIRKAIDDQRKRPPTRELVDDRAADDAGLLRFEQDRSFFAMVQALPTQQRRVLVLRYHLDLDDARIANLLGVSRATVRSNAMRGLQKLRAEVKPEEAPPPTPAPSMDATVTDPALTNPAVTEEDR